MMNWFEGQWPDLFKCFVQRLVDIRRLERAAHAHPVAQIFPSGEIRLERRLVTHISHLGVKAVQVLAHIFTPPEHLALLRMGKAAQQSQ